MTSDDVSDVSSEEDEQDRLNRFLDDLSHGVGTSPGNLDPGLVASVRQVHLLAEIDDRATSTSADRARLWRDLLRLPDVIAPSDTRWSRGPRLGIVQSFPVCPRPAIMSGTVRLISTLAAVLVLVVSTLSLYQRVPGTGSTPTVMAAGFPDSATASPDAMAPLPTVASNDGVAWVRPAYSDCIGPRADYSNVMEIIVGKDYPFDDQPPAPRIAAVQIGPGSVVQYVFTELPPGDEVSQPVIHKVSDTYGRYLSCDGLPLRQAPLFSDDGLAREYWEAPSVFPHDGGVDGDQMMLLWADAQGRQRLDRRGAGESSRSFLYEFRRLPDGRVAALLSLVGATEPGTHPAIQQDAGYVVFVEVAGKWLIDEQLVPRVAPV